MAAPQLEEEEEEPAGSQGCESEEPLRPPAHLLHRPVARVGTADRCRLQVHGPAVAACQRALVEG
eukprot:13225330-Alexandrium_andersonii.AAC.1